MRRVRLEIHGRVQGVFFRQTLQNAARQLGVSGSARNLPDGTVLAYLEGTPECVEAAIKVAATGPLAAHVEHVEITDEAPTGESGFTTG